MLLNSSQEGLHQFILPPSVCETFMAQSAIPHFTMCEENIGIFSQQRYIL